MRNIETEIIKQKQVRKDVNRKEERENKLSRSYEKTEADGEAWLSDDPHKVGLS